MDSKSAQVAYVPPPDATDGERKPVHTIRDVDARASVWKSEENGADMFTLTVDRDGRSVRKGSPSVLE